MKTCTGRYCLKLEDNFGSIKSAFIKAVVKELVFCCGFQYCSLLLLHVSSCMWRLIKCVLKYVTSLYKHAGNGSLLLLFLGVGVEDPGVPGLAQPNAEPHHRIRPAGRFPTLCLLCD